MKKIIIGSLILVFAIGLAGCQKNNIKSATPDASYYQDLKNKCAAISNSFQAECCLDSVKTMEVVGGTLFPGGKYEESGKYKCDDGFERMVLRCPGSYAWCQPANDFDDEDSVPVPQDIPRIRPNAGHDNDGNGPICTEEAKSCGDGTYVGRTGPNCEFAPCPGEKPTADFVPTKDNPIQLPDNVITEKECAAQGGEVFNTLGETSYNGELIGKVEGLMCPCACLIKNEGSDKIWVDINGNLEEFTGNLDDIQTFDDCKKAGFKITDDIPATCTVGEPHMTGGKYKTFTNNPMEAGKTCSDYHYSTCPGSCVRKCTSSSCSDPDENGAVACTSDCDGAGSCVAK